MFFFQACVLLLYVLVQTTACLLTVKSCGGQCSCKAPASVLVPDPASVLVTAPASVLVPAPESFLVTAPVSVLVPAPACVLVTALASVLVPAPASNILCHKQNGNKK